ncbi:Poly(A) polymerase PAPalpha [Astathelohania contejeani]|uniref:Poly(A) polymerase n=1 Tax=Astathelohania contejeani TaxID=164912 RepID=A0ABQ7HX00_9MICR|nr:Poly(A) polymerase PAPalpha [Thelohania contejeani]
MHQTNKKYGITGALSFKESTPSEQAKSEYLAKYLEKSGFFESEDQAYLRERVLGRLDFLIKQFVRDTGEVKGMSTDEAQRCGGTLFTFGSYRLGVHARGADIDALCVVPRHVSRKDFFTGFYELLEAEPHVTDLAKVEEAYVPLIKFVCQGIPIDLVFARINQPSVPDNLNLLSNALLRGMDEKCVLSVNGNRVTDELLGLVPDTNRFHAALRCIKYWAMRRGVYGNSFGYYGGVAYAISVARICQLFPNASPVVLVHKFFDIYAKWKWPTPVLLQPIEDHGYNLKVWDPKVHPADKFHRMPVITPAYPSMCSTHNVFTSTANLLIEEFKRGSKILNKLLEEKEDKTILDDIIKELFTMSNFFVRYKRFIMVLIGGNGEADDFKRWEGFVESKIRILASKLEMIEEISDAPPFPKAFKMETWKLCEKCPAFNRIANISSMTNCTCFFIALGITGKQMINNKKIIIDIPVKEFKEFVNEKKSAGLEIYINALSRRDMQAFLQLYYRKNK